MNALLAADRATVDAVHALALQHGGRCEGPPGLRPEYHAKLSEDSKRSLQLQGGVFDAGQAAQFIALPAAKDAVMLRQWDDLAKQADWRTPTLSHFLDVASRCALPRPAAA